MTSTVKQLTEPPLRAPETAEDACKILDDCEAFYGASRRFVQENQRALKNNDWRALETMMLDGGLFSKEGIGGIVADYRVWRPGVKTRLSVLLCKEDKQAIPFPFDFTALKKRYGTVEYMPIIPIRMIFSSGNIGGEEGELFIVPTAWKKMPRLANAPPFLDIEAQTGRMCRRTGNHHWTSILDENIAYIVQALLADSAAYRRALYWEYSLHEYGHACGKFAENIAIISSKMEYAAFEEWRSDGIMAQIVRLHLEKGIITPVEARNILISNFMTRFGVDITRQHARLDHDFISAYYAMRGFLKSGVVTLNEGLMRVKRGNPESPDFWLSLYGVQAEGGEKATGIANPFGAIEKFLPSDDYHLQEFQSFAHRRKS